VDVAGSHRPLGIDARGPFIDDPTPRIGRDDSDLDDPVDLRLQTGGLDINHSKPRPARRVRLVTDDRPIPFDRPARSLSNNFIVCVLQSRPANEEISDRSPEVLTDAAFRVALRAAPGEAGSSRNSPDNLAHSVRRQPAFMHISAPLTR